ncbi:MAG: phosphoheptose isomerase [Legionellales bacterium]|jgi:phosphoheptose isomerase|nr:phosphoheptose isomerase [Legionellales bacterium]
MTQIIESEINRSKIANRIINNFQNSIDVKTASLSALKQPITNASLKIFTALQNGNKVLCCGNGGSAADSQHFVAELVNRFEIERPPLAAISLTTDTSILTSVSNDYSYDLIFEKQVKALGKEGDILFVISTSGNSGNIINAIQAAKDKKMNVISLSGNFGGKAAKLLTATDIEIRVPSNTTARIQETHILAIHCLCDAIDWQYIETNGEASI